MYVLLRRFERTNLFGEVEDSLQCVSKLSGGTHLASLILVIHIPFPTRGTLTLVLVIALISLFNLIIFT